MCIRDRTWTLPTAGKVTFPIVLFSVTFSVFNIGTGCISINCSTSLLIFFFCLQLSLLLNTLSLTCGACQNRFIRCTYKIDFSTLAILFNMDSFTADILVIRLLNLPKLHRRRDVYKRQVLFNAIMKHSQIHRK